MANDVNHCEGDNYYGKAKKGEYMSEANGLGQGILRRTRQIPHHFMTQP